MAGDEERISTGSILLFSSPVLGVFFAGALSSMFLLKFTTDVLLVAPAAMATVLLAGRVWDAISDPVVGYLSDRTKTRLGRRRPWLLGSAVPLALSVVALWSPPRSLEGTALVIWIAGAYLLYYTFFTTFRVPHLAFAAELSRGYHDRTRVFGLMQAMESIGMMLGAGGVLLLETTDDPRTAAAGLSVGMAIVGAVMIAVTGFTMREREEFQERGGESSRRAFGDVFANPHARLLVAIFFLEQLGFAVLIVLLPFLSDYVFVTPGRTAVYMLVALVALLGSIPLWVIASRRFGKKPVWIFSIAMKTVIFGSFYFLGAGDFVIAATLTGLFGAMAGCGSVVGPSLKADVVDWDEGRTGERKEGAYFATWNFAQKTAGGIAGWLTGTMLAVTGFVPNVAQSEEALRGMRLLVSVWPCVLHGIALLLVTRFSLDEITHRAARESARTRAGSAS